MFDAKLLFSDKQVATAGADSTHQLDLGQEAPDLGMLKKLTITCIATTAFTGGSSPKITIEVHHADDNGHGAAGSYSKLLSTGELDATKVEYVDIPLPIAHKRWIKLHYTVTGSPSTGNITAGITDGTQKNPFRTREI